MRCSAVLTLQKASGVEVFKISPANTGHIEKCHPLSSLLHNEYSVDYIRFTMDKNDYS
jgi:hypothetical protein